MRGGAEETLVVYFLARVEKEGWAFVDRVTTIIQNCDPKSWDKIGQNNYTFQDAR
jgi:hypothetical protein